MTVTASPPQSQDFVLWHEAQDMHTRTRLGGIFYLIAWLFIWLFNKAPGEHLALGLGVSAFFTLLLTLRLLHRLPEDDAQQALQRWIDLHWTLLLITALGWGVAAGWALQGTDADSRMIAIISTVAFSTAFIYNFPMRRGRTQWAILLLYLPGMGVLALQWREQYAILATLGVYMAYLVLALSRSHREYRSNLLMEQQLLEQRERFELLSRTDSLTLLGNRYQFNQLFAVMVANAQRRGSPLSLVLMDIDFFKKINDGYGHAVGDSCLQAFAERMRHTFRRDGDALLRLGGEEFGVLMPDTSLEQARQLGERFRHDLASHGVQLPGMRLPLTTSIGIGCFDSSRDSSAEAFFKRVDDALYRAKADGRDRLVTAQEA